MINAIYPGIEHDTHPEWFVSEAEAQAKKAEYAARRTRRQFAAKVRKREHILHAICTSLFLLACTYFVITSVIGTLVLTGKI